MTRVQNRAANAHSKKTSTALTNRKKKPYKIVFESVTQEKKKLRSAVSYNAQAPLGYTFVPAGTPDLTEYCKELCRTRGKEVHIVSAAPKNRAHNNPGRISHHIHRVGHHFPSGIVDKACDWLGYTRKNGIFTKHLDVGINSHFARSLAKHKKQLGKDPSETTDEEIRAAIKDLFPKIPDRDVTSILNHAFRQGTKRVGNAKELTLPRRIQLAVLAHIRHVYTDYDKVLKQSEWMDARRHVEPACLNQLLKWRGEDESGPTELEDIFRETIIIDDSDDEDSENPIADASDSGIERAPSVEIISERANARDLLTNDLNNVDWIDADSTQHVPNRAYFVRSKPKVKLVPINLQPRDLPLRERQYIPESPLRRTTYDAHLGIRTEMVPSTADYAAGRSFHFSSNSDSMYEYQTLVLNTTDKSTSDEYRRPYSTSSGTVINNQPPNSHFVEWNGKLYESVSSWIPTEVRWA
ncbi:hypothetical protein M501DRAFT_934488 [Patellaria atrata CBS 101060]|uniref:DUF2293 domain-containing protein n=1 Tax=Patellaria atrata CBS 101060 TaxID=1346257 RepID=A0A9P4VRH0_9PEZI|nr:hypothetical protein M501DRAFT_934488 [Patellaria atrata CBS 101060]